MTFSPQVAKIHLQLSLRRLVTVVYLIRPLQSPSAQNPVSILTPFVMVMTGIHFKNVTCISI